MRETHTYEELHKVVNGIEYKLCIYKKHWLPCDKEHFYKNKSNTDGLHSYCKECTKEKSNSIPRIKNIFNEMKKRCYGKNNPNYHHYGGRGIKICDEWLNDFQSFCKWSMENGYTEELTIDRKDVNGDYSPDNCRWIDLKTQQSNRTNNRLIEIDGIVKNVQQWADFAGVKNQLIFGRLNRGITGRDLLKPPHKKKTKINN